MTIIKIDNCNGEIVGYIPQHVLIGIDQKCSFDIKGAEMSQLYKKGRWDGKKRLFNKKKKTFALGLLPRVESVLKAHEIAYDIDDTRKPIVNTQEPIRLSGNVVGRDYQLEAKEKARRYQRGVLHVATGGGKTVIASLIISDLSTKTIFLVHTKDLLYQAKSSFEDALDCPIGQIGDGIIDIKDVTVATIQTMGIYLNIDIDNEDVTEAKPEVDKNGKYSKAEQVQKFVDEVGLLIFDEVHRVACDSAYSVCQSITSAKYRIGLSASPFRDDGADMMIDASIGEVIYKLSATDLIDKGFLVPPIIRFHRIPANINPAIDNRTYEQIYRDEIVNNDYRNQKILKYASDFMELGLPTMILVQQINHGRKLKKLISENYHPIDFISGQNFTNERLRAIEEMRDGDRISMIASTIADEGLDIKRLTALIIASGGKSSTRALQRVGRVLRPFDNKTHAIVVDFTDESKFLIDHSIKRKEMYQLESGFTILEL